MRTVKALFICSFLLSLVVSRADAGKSAPPRQLSSELETYLDPIVRHELQAHHTPGAAVLVVLNGQIVLEKGYGLANREEHTQVKANKTVFRMGSVSKLFTTTAVLQLVEQGKLHLQDPVNPYLKTFQIDNPFPEPVRVFHLLTHTAGFDERIMGTATLKESEVVPLGQYLANRMPPCVRRPGDLISYSNHGFTLAGYLVELISGMPFEDYVKKHILAPLGMHSSTFNVKESQSPNLATGYIFENGDFHQVPFDYVNDDPADGLVSTASDMARFMIANLQQGRYGNAQILKPETVADMQSQHFTHHAGMPGWCYGFYEEYGNNVRSLVHDGAVFGYTTRVLLVPEKKLGVFVATNRDMTSGPFVASVITSRLLDFYFPAAQRHVRPGIVSPDFARRARLCEGYYRHTSNVVRTLEKIGVLMRVAPEIKVELNQDDTMTIEDKNFVEIEPYFFQQTTGKSFAWFRQSGDQPATHVFVEQEAFERIQWFETKRFQLTLAASCLSIFLVTCILWLIRAMRRNRRADIARLYLVSGLTSMAHLIFIPVLILTVARKHVFELNYAVPLALKIALVLPLVALALTPLMLRSLFQTWKNHRGALFERIYFSISTLAGVGFLWVLYYWNLIGFRY